MSSKTKKDWGQFKKDQLDNDESMLFNEDEVIDDDTSEAVKIDHPDYSDLEEKLSLAEKKVHENWEKATRAVAELENIRRRTERDIANAHKYGLEKFIDGLLPVLDSLEQALQLADEDTHKGMHEGLTLTMKLFLDVLSKNGVSQIDPIGEVFNPEVHEAMSMQESADAAPNTILVVFQKGYKLNDRVIRPARVIVAK